MKVYTIRKYPGIDRMGQRALYALAQGAERLNLNLDDLLAHIWIESGFKADIKNPYSTASGLLQMVDATARHTMGVSAAQLREMSALEQVPGILKYYAGLGPLAGPIFRVLGYSRNPSLVGAPESRVIYKAGSAIAKGHPHAQAPDGSITVGSIGREFRIHKAKHDNAGFFQLEPPADAAPPPAPAKPKGKKPWEKPAPGGGGSDSGLVFFIAVAVGGLAYLAISRRGKSGSS